MSVFALLDVNSFMIFFITKLHLIKNIDLKFHIDIFKIIEKYDFKSLYGAVRYIVLLKTLWICIGKSCLYKKELENKMLLNSQMETLKP